MNNQIAFVFPDSGTKTQKLASLIEIASVAPILLPETPFHYKISGDVLELHVNKDCDSNEDLRLSVMNCGMVLSYIQKALEEKGYVSLIQSFPNVSEPRLIAFIRMEKQGSMQDLILKDGKSMTGKAGLQALKQMLTEKNIGIYELTQKTAVNQLIESSHNMKNDSNSQITKTQSNWTLCWPRNNERSHTLQSGNKVWLLNTHADNAISWLNTGKTLGKLLLRCNHGLLNYQFDINLLKNEEFRYQISRQYAMNGCTQLLLKPTCFK